MSPYDRGQSDGQAQPHLQYERAFGPERTSPRRSHGPTRGNMPPPPIPVDPALDSWNTPNTAISPSIALDHLLQPTAGLLERPNFVGVPAVVDVFPHNVQLPSTKQSDLDTNPLFRFYNDPGPWSSQRIAEDLNQPSLPPRYSGSYSRLNPPVGASNQYRDTPRSDLGSNTTGRNPLDSGYESKSVATKSVRSTEHVDHSQECQSLIGDVNEMQIYPDEHFQGHDLSLPQGVPYPFDISNVPEDPAALLPLICPEPECHQSDLKSQSDLRKHMLRHTKPFVCEESNCNRKAGFSTKNDLERHKKSVHKITPRNASDKSYRCAATNCPKKEKIWPRLDNFRQHCSRMHKEMDCEELVRISHLNSGFSLRSHNVDDFSQELDLSKAERDLTKPPEFTNLHALQNVLPAGMEVHESPNSLSQFIGRGHLEGHGSHIQVHDADTRQYHISPTISITLPDQNQASLLEGTDGTVQFISIKRSASSCNSPQRDRTQEQAEQPPQATTRYLGIQAAHQEERTAIQTNAEQVSQAMASDVVKRMSTGSVEEIQAILEQSVLKLLHTNRTRKRSSAEISSADTPDPKRKRVACEYCSKTMIRLCDLKKHNKRHTRPYGCTFTSCTKAFGSKNDWKRHENTQHYQIETWRCHEESPTSLIKLCARVFHRREQFQAHLKDHHLIESDEYIRAQARQHRIGRNGQTGFWCGFCQRIISLQKRGLEAWDERFNHIDDLHFKKGQGIHQWYPLDKDVPKGFMRTEDVPESEGPSSGPDGVDSTEGSSDDAEQGLSPPCTEGAYSAHSSPPTMQAGSSADCFSNELKQSRMWYCCKCTDGPHSYILDAKCTSCHAPRCDMCQKSLVNQ